MESLYVAKINLYHTPAFGSKKRVNIAQFWDNFSLVLMLFCADLKMLFIFLNISWPAKSGVNVLFASPSGLNHVVLRQILRIFWLEKISNNTLLNRFHQEDIFIITTKADLYGRDMSYEKNQNKITVDPRR